MKLSELVRVCMILRDPNGPPQGRGHAVRFDAVGNVVDACAVGRIALAIGMPLRRKPRNPIGFIPHDQLPRIDALLGGDWVRRLVQDDNDYRGATLDQIAEWLWDLHVADAEVDVPAPEYEPAVA